MTNFKNDRTRLPLHVLFVDSERQLIREILTTCYLSRQTMPKIVIYDNIIADVLDIDSGDSLPFYDIDDNRFNFTCSNLMNLDVSSRSLPREIIIEILECGDEDYEPVTYIHLEPGLWKKDDNKRYHERICDNSIFHTVMDTKILPNINNETFDFDDGAAIERFYRLNNSLEFQFDFLKDYTKCDFCEMYDDQHKCCTYTGGECKYTDETDNDCPDGEICDDCE
jgi:hypothetical protein